MEDHLLGEGLGWVEVLKGVEKLWNLLTGYGERI